MVELADRGVFHAHLILQSGNFRRKGLFGYSRLFPFLFELARHNQQLVVFAVDLILKAFADAVCRKPASALFEL